MGYRIGIGKRGPEPQKDEMIFLAVIDASFMQIAQELNNFINILRNEDPNSRIVVEMGTNKIDLSSYQYGMWNDGDYGSPDVDVPTFLGNLGIIENLNQENIYTNPVQVRIISRSPGYSWFWQEFIFNLKSRFIVNETHKDEQECSFKPWMQILDKGWDRKALELWCKGLTGAKIAAKLSTPEKTLTEKTIRNKLSALRKIYGEQIVPYRKQNKSIET